MARDFGLEDLLNEDLVSEPGLTGKPMFGGWAWLIHGNLMSCARHDGMLARVGIEQADTLVALPGIVPMYSGTRRMRGWVRADPELWGDDERRRSLLRKALDFTRALPAK